MMKHVSKATAGLVILASWSLVPAFSHHRDGLIASLARFGEATSGLRHRDGLIASLARFGEATSGLRPASQWALSLSAPAILIGLATVMTILLGVTESHVRSERDRLLLHIALLCGLFSFSVFVFRCLFWLGDPV